MKQWLSTRCVNKALLVWFHASIQPPPRQPFSTLFAYFKSRVDWFCLTFGGGDTNHKQNTNMSSHYAMCQHTLVYTSSRRETKVASIWSQVADHVLNRAAHSSSSTLISSCCLHQFQTRELIAEWLSALWSWLEPNSQLVILKRLDIMSNIKRRPDTRTDFVGHYIAQEINNVMVSLVLRPLTPLK